MESIKDNFKQHSVLYVNLSTSRFDFRNFPIRLEKLKLFHKTAKVQHILTFLGVLTFL